MVSGLCGIQKICYGNRRSIGGHAWPWQHRQLLLAVDRDGSWCWSSRKMGQSLNDLWSLLEAEVTLPNTTFLARVVISKFLFISIIAFHKNGLGGPAILYSVNSRVPNALWRCVISVSINSVGSCVTRDRVLGDSVTIHSKEGRFFFSFFPNWATWRISPEVSFR